MGRRLELGALLKEVTEVPNIYFQPPTSRSISHPCVIYGPAKGTTEFADNIPFIIRDRYIVTVIDSDPDSAIPEKIAKLPTCILDRTYTVNNLNHWVFLLYF